MKISHQLRATAVTAAIAVAMAASPAIAQSHLEVIVGNHTDSFTTDFASPFFKTTLPELSGGKITSNVVPYIELGLTGFEMMDLLNLGTNDISWTLPSYLSGQTPLAEGIELPGLTDDITVMREAQAAFRPIIDDLYNEHFNSRVLFMYNQPNNQAFCKLSDDEIANFSLATLAGKKVRVHSTAYADYVESFGGVPVTMAFADVVPGLERGVIDCALTSPNVAYGSKFGQVSNAVVNLPIGFALHMFVMNNDSWNSLDTDTQAMMTDELSKLEAAMVDHTIASVEESAVCLTDGPCPLGEPAGMTRIELTQDDRDTLRQSVQDTVLARWAERCGEGCADTWNGALSDIIGLTIQ